MSLHDEMVAMGDRAVAASRELVLLSTRKKNAVLQSIADAIDAGKADVVNANRLDTAQGTNAGLSQAMLDRLELPEPRIDAMIRAIRAVAGLKDPVGSKISRWIRPNGLEIVKCRVPIGVIGVIYESRPNVTADAATLCLKTSNAVILRGGSEAINTNRSIVAAVTAGIKERGVSEDAVQLVTTTDHEAVRELVQLEGKVDLVIPRGGESLMRVVTEEARVPVIKHYKGVCHTYVDKSADLAMAMNVVENAKCQRPGVCNAMETLLVHEQVAAEFLPRMSSVMGEHRVELRGDVAARSILPGINDAVEDDWYAEYLDLILAIRVVSSVEDAVIHINRYGSGHSDAIIAQDEVIQKIFTQRVDSSTVYVNASTRFTDGSEFGMGAEIGISTEKLHARGPMGLEELTTHKYVVYGTGQVRE